MHSLSASMQARVSNWFEPNYASICRQQRGSLSRAGHAVHFSAAGHEALDSVQPEFQWRFLFWLAPTQARAPNWFRIKLCSRLSAAPWVSSGWPFSAAGQAVQFSAAGHEALDSVQLHCLFCCLHVVHCRISGVFSSVGRAFAMSLNSFEVHGVNKLQLTETWISEQELMHAHEGGRDAQHLVA